MTRRLLFTPDVPIRPGAAVGGRRRGDRPRRGVLRLGGGGAARPGGPGRRSRDAILDLAARYTARLIEVSRAARRSSSTTCTGSTRRASGCSTRSSASPRSAPLLIVIGTRPGPTPADRRAGRRRATSRWRASTSRETRRAGRGRRGLGARAVGRAPAPRADRRQPAVHHRDGPGDLRRRRGAGRERRAPADGRMPDDDGTVRPGMPMTLRALLGAAHRRAGRGGPDRAPGRVGHRHDVPRAGRRRRRSATRSRRTSTTRLAEASLIVADRGTGRLALLPPAHPRRRVPGPARERPPATPHPSSPIASSRRDGPVPIGVVARHRAAARRRGASGPAAGSGPPRMRLRSVPRRRLRRSGRRRRISSRPVPAADELPSAGPGGPRGAAGRPVDVHRRRVRSIRRRST